MLQTTVEQILDNMPAEWTVLTTHRLDIYDESQAKIHRSMWMRYKHW